MVGLIVFGGTDPVTGYEIEQNKSAFEVAFAIHASKKAWAAVGAAPLTRSCLNDKKVRRQLGDAKDSMNELMLSLQDGNLNSTALLTQHEYEGDRLRVFLKKNPVKPRMVTKPNSLERQQLLAKAGTHGEKFTATGGGHLTSDDMFKAMALACREKELSAAQVDKAKRLAATKTHQAALSVLCQSKAVDSYNVAELNTLLKWFCIPIAKCPSKASKQDRWRQILVSGVAPPTYHPWTAKDEQHLQELQDKNVSITDTALGRHRAVKKRELFASVATMSHDDRKALQAELDYFGMEAGGGVAGDGSAPDVERDDDIADAVAGLVGLGEDGTEQAC